MRLVESGPRARIFDNLAELLFVSAVNGKMLLNFLLIFSDIPCGIWFGHSQDSRWRSPVAVRIAGGSAFFLKTNWRNHESI